MAGVLILISVVILSAWPASAAGKGGAVAPKPSYSVPQTWTSANKDGFGTAYTYGSTSWPKASRVWFTLLNGGFSEIYYPTFDTVAVNRLRFLVSNGHWLDDEEKDLKVSVRFADPHALAYAVTSTSAKHGYRLTRTVITDPSRDALLMQVRYDALSPAARKYALYLNLEPTLDNTSLGNSIAASGGMLTVWIGGKAMALRTTAHVAGAYVGYRGLNDPATQLRAGGRVAHPYTQAGRGRVAGALRIAPGGTFTVALGFGPDRATAGRTAAAALKTSFGKTERAYIAGWHGYTSHLGRLGGKANAEWYESAMTIKAAEDKTYEGAIVASPTHPWGDTSNDDPTAHGYVLVWPRDLYHAAMGLLAAGDARTAREALSFLAGHRNRDGSQPQNMHVDGTPFWTGVQMDEASDAVLLAWRLKARDLYHSLVLPTARFIAAHGPTTPQERWEEAGGYSPASIAAEIAALAAAAQMAGEEGDRSHAKTFLDRADEWQKKVDGWTYTTNGPHGDHHYYLRITATGDPNSSLPFTLANGGGTYDQRSIVDPSYLELARLGVKAPNDPHITSTIPVVDAVVEHVTPKGPDWHRYNHDGYGDPPTPFGAGEGHLWPVFAGERGNYEVLAGKMAAARSLLATYGRFAGPTGLIPEQVWEKTGTGTHSATPLIWAQGEYLVLLRSVVDRKGFDRPSVATKRYAR